MLVDIVVEMDELKRDWAAGSSDLRTDTRRAVSHATAVAAQTVKRDVPVKTGKLRDSVQSSFRSTEGGGVGNVDVTAGHAEFILNGTKDHGPVKAKALRFEIGGQVIFARRVRGIKPQDFLYEGEKQAERTAHEDIERAIAKFKARIES